MHNLNFTVEFVPVKNSKLKLNAFWHGNLFYIAVRIAFHLGPLHTKLSASYCPIYIRFKGVLLSSMWK